MMKTSMNFVTAGVNSKYGDTTADYKCARP
jgi:hypothetical protein